MSDEMKYCEVLKQIGEILHQKKQYIEMRHFEIDRLKEKLEQAEKRIAELEG